MRINLLYEDVVLKAAKYAKHLISTTNITIPAAISVAAKEYHIPTTLIASSSLFSPKKPKIKWVKPSFREEAGEYFRNDHIKRFLSNKGYKFNSINELITFLRDGYTEVMDRTELLVKPKKNITASREEFNEKLNDADYARSYHNMNDKLIRDKIVALPSPILVKFPDTYFGFSGNRRTNLAFNYGLPVKFWIVEASDQSSKQASLF